MTLLILCTLASLVIFVVVYKRVLKHQIAGGTPLAKLPNMQTHVSTGACSTFAFWILGFFLSHLHDLIIFGWSAAVAFLLGRSPGFHSPFEMPPPHFQSGAYQAAILGFLIAAAAYVWYWDRRTAIDRINAALALIVTPIAAGAPAAPAGLGGPAFFSGLTKFVQQVIDRSSPATIALVLVLMMSVAVMGGPGFLRAIEAKIGKDGSISLALRENREREPTATQMNYGSTDGGLASDSEAPVLSWLSGRIDRDILSICALAAWRENESLRNVGSFESKFINSLPSHEDCEKLPERPTSATAKIKVENPNGAPTELYELLKPIRDYRELSESRTTAMIKCFTEIYQRPDRRVELRSMTRPLLDSYGRLDIVLPSTMNRTVKSISENASKEMSAYLGALAGIATFGNLEGPRSERRTAETSNSGKERAEEPDSGKQLSNCSKAAIFAKELAEELKNPRPGPICRSSNASENTTDTHTQAICRLVELDATLPYGRLAFAAFTYLEKEPAGAILQIEKLLGEKPGDNAASSSRHGEPIDSWFRFTAVNLQNLIVKFDFDKPGRNNDINSSILALHSKDSAKGLLGSQAAQFEEIAKKHPEICGDRRTLRLTLLMMISYEERQYQLEKYIKSENIHDLIRAFRDKNAQAAFRNVFEDRAWIKCMLAWSPLLDGFGELRLLGLGEQEADYWLAYARFLETPDGRAAALKMAETTPRLLRESAGRLFADNLVDVRRLIEGCARQNSESKLCNGAYISIDGRRDMFTLLTSRNRLSQYESRVAEKFAALKADQSD